MKLIFLGGQGSGKTTQAEIVAERLNLPCINMGQIFRDRTRKNDPQALKIKNSLDKGLLVPDDIVVAVYQDRIHKTDCRNGYILDGYPRNLVQLEGLEPDMDKVFYVKVSDKEGIKRLMGRERDDDTAEVIAQRLKIYHQETEPLLAHFRKQGILDQVNGERSVEEITEDIKERLENGIKN